MSEELPAGWANFALTDIGGVSGGKTPSKANPEFWSSRDVPWISPKDMKKDLLGDSEDRISQIALDKAGMTRYPAGAVLMVTRSGILQHSFPVALAGVSVTVNQDIKVLRPVVGIDPKFSFYLLKSFSQAILSACSKDGTTVQSIDSEKLESFIFPLPPAAEQIRIAQKLDELLTQVDTIKARIEAIPALLKRFRQSVLAAAVSGRLTEKWRVDSTGSAKEEGASYQSIQVSEPWSHTIEAPANWTSHIFENVIKLIGGSQPPKSEFIFEEGPGLVRLIQIRDYKGDNHKVFIRSEATKKFCSADDVMIGRYGPPIFQILKGLSGAYNVALMKAVPLAGVLQNDYMYRYLQNYKILNFVEAGSDRTAGQSGVNKAFLDKYPIFLPSLTEQTEIVRRVEQLFAFADQLEAKVASAKTRIDHLTQSILAKAFRGELVPQDPNDEPASVLLERIKAERTNAPKAKRSRKASKASV